MSSIDDILREHLGDGTPANDQGGGERRPAHSLPAARSPRRAPTAARVVPAAPALDAAPIAETPAGRELAELLADPPPLIKPPPLRLPIGLHLDVSHEDYLRDPGETPTLSSSVAHTLATRAPLHGWHMHPRLGNGDPVEPTASMGRGSILHKLLLGKGQEIAVFDFDDFKKDVAKRARDQAIREGKIPIVAAKFKPLEATAKVLLRRLADRGIVLDGQSEVTGICEIGGVLCRIRVDHLKATDEVTIFDIKTCADAAPERAVSSMVEYGADVQHAEYTEAIAALMPEFVGRIRMRFLFCEADAPNDVIVYDPPGDMRELGARRWKRGREVWRRNLETYGEKEWPGYSATPIKIGPPAWAVARDDEIAFNRMETNVKPPF